MGLLLYTLHSKGNKAYRPIGLHIVCYYSIRKPLLNGTDLQGGAKQLTDL